MVDGEPRNGANEAGPQEPPAPGTSSPAGSGEERALCKDDVNSVVAGVAAGLGRYTGIDPVVWRTAFAVTALAGGAGVWLYIAAWLLMRDARGGPAILEQLLNRSLTGPAVLALLGVGLSIGVAFSLVGGFGWGTLVLTIPLVLGGLVAHGRGVDLKQVARDLPGWLKTGEPPPAAPQPESVPSYYNPAQPWAAPPPGPIDLAVVGRQATERSTPGEATEDDRDHLGGAGPHSPFQHVQVRGRSDGRLENTQTGSVRERRGVSLLSLAFWGVLAFTGVTFALTGGVSLSALVAPESGALYLGGVVTLLGVALVIGTWIGDTRGLAGFAALVTLLAVAAVTVNLTTLRFGEVVWRPTTAAEAQQPFDLTAGQALLDLTALRLRPGQEVTVNAQVGFGGLTMLAPDSARVIAHGTAVIGQLQFGDGPPQTGMRLELQEVLEPRSATGSEPDGTRSEEEAAEDRADPPELTVNLTSYTGDLEVRHVSP